MTRTNAGLRLTLPVCVVAAGAVLLSPGAAAASQRHTERVGPQAGCKPTLRAALKAAADGAPSASTLAGIAAE